MSQDGHPLDAIQLGRLDIDVLSALGERHDLTRANRSSRLELSFWGRPQELTNTCVVRLLAPLRAKE